MNSPCRDALVSSYSIRQEPDDLFETISQALLAAVDRDAISGWGADVYVMCVCRVCCCFRCVWVSKPCMFHACVYLVFAGLEDFWEDGVSKWTSLDVPQVGPVTRPLIGDKCSSICYTAKQYVMTDNWNWHWMVGSASASHYARCTILHAPNTLCPPSHLEKVWSYRIKIGNTDLSICGESTYFLSVSDPKEQTVLISSRDFQHVGDSGRHISMSEMGVQWKDIWPAMWFTLVCSRCLWISGRVGREVDSQCFSRLCPILS